MKGGLIVVGTIRKEVKKEKLRMGEDYLREFQKKVIYLLNDSIRRAKQNNRTTLKARDV